MAKKSSPKLSERQAEAVQIKALGGEPMFTALQTLSEVQLMEAFSWYSAIKDWTDAKQYLLEYVSKFRSDLTDAVRRVPESKIITFGWIARMKSRGIQLSQHVDQRFNSYLSQLEANYPAFQGGVKSTSLTTKTDRFGEYVAEFETALDNRDPKFSAYGYLNSKQVNRSYVARIREYYMPVLSELLQAAQGKDSQLIEAYKHMKKSEIAAVAIYVDRFIDDCDRYLNNTKTVRTPRKKKAKKPDQILKHFKFKLEDQDLKIKSVDPTLILGASSLFALNTTNNVLTVFIAKEGGLQIHRASIANYDEQLTKSKRVGKKIKAVIAAILEGNKKQRDSVLSLVSSDQINVTDRINTSTVLLKVVK